MNDDLDSLIGALEPLCMSDAELEQRIEICESETVRFALRVMLAHSREASGDTQP